MVVGSLAVGLLLAPPPDAVAELVIELDPDRCVVGHVDC